MTSQGIRELREAINQLRAEESCELVTQGVMQLANQVKELPVEVTVQGEDDDKVIASVKSVYAGMSIFGENVYRVMREQMQRNANPVAASPKTSENSIHFTNRELDVIRMVAQGYDNKEIASQLYLAEGTVRNQISKVSVV